MFTGIIETTGILKEITSNGTNRIFWIQSAISAGLSIDQSVSHNGVCLTVEAVEGDSHRLTAIEETLSKTNLAFWKTGGIVNMERSLQMNGRLDGHIVQGHADTTAVCTNITEKNGSWEYTFKIDKKFSGLIIEKGSIASDGISLTIFNVTENSFSVAIIPYTYEHTNIRYLIKGSTVNIEFDMVGKYVNRIMNYAKL